MYTTEELKELQERAERALRAIQKPVEHLPAGTVPAATLIQIDELLFKINQYAAEIRRREAADAAKNAAASLRLFLSYRRKDDLAMGSLGRIKDALITHFGEPNIFVDHDNILFGQAFKQVIEARVKDADFLVAVIGRQWLEMLRARQHDPEDYVRFELETALRHAVPIIPLLLGDTPVPKAEELPDFLSAFPQINAASVDPGWRFHDDMLHFAEHLKLLGGRHRQS